MDEIPEQLHANMKINLLSITGLEFCFQSVFQTLKKEQKTMLCGSSAEQMVVRWAWILRSIPPKQNLCCCGGSWGLRKQSARTFWRVFLVIQKPNTDKRKKQFAPTKNCDFMKEWMGN